MLTIAVTSAFANLLRFYVQKTRHDNLPGRNVFQVMMCA